MESNSLIQGIYPYDTDEAGWYFTTDFGITYTVYLVEINAEGVVPPPGRLFQFGFHPLNKPHDFRLENRDVKIKRTIISILVNEILINPDFIIYYVCDSSDGGARTRNILFSMWVKELMPGNILKFSFTVDRDDTLELIYASALLLDTYREKDIISKTLPVYFQMSKG